MTRATTEVTYGQIDKMLRSHGFSVRLDNGDDRHPPARVYKHESGALLLLPPFPEEQKVYPHHLVATRVTLDNYNLVSPLDFDAELQKAS